jgi:hypothetical protein
MQKNLAAADERPPVIVFTCGRTGSTLLIRMLNCLPRTIMWGEHNGALKPLLSSYSRLRDVAENKFVARAANLLQPVYDREPILSVQGMSIEWLNWFTVADIDRVYREFVTGLFYPESARGRFSRWGFKEIQYRDVELGLLRKLFPGMKAIILYRNPAAIIASQFKNFAKEDGERLPRVLKNVGIFYQFAAQQAQQESDADESPLFISYEEVVGDFDGSVRVLQEFLKEEFLPSVGEIENNIGHFRSRKFVSKWSGDPLEDIEKWQRASDLEVPARKFRLIVDNYEAVIAATTAKTRAINCGSVTRSMP